MNQGLDECPVCSGPLRVSRYTCDQCRTEISGYFQHPGEFSQLSPELMEFVKVFIYCEGSIKQSEKLLNCSYPKIKNLLKKTKTALGIVASTEADEDSVINRLERGEIDVKEALALLKTRG